MVLVGLTGGIASGKSLVSELFQQMGAYLIDADELAHRAIEPGAPAWKPIRDHFGPDILHKDQTINRRRLGEIVFRDSKERQWLNSVVHPEVFKEQERLCKEMGARDPHAVIIYDAALLIETGAYQRMDIVILVVADPKTQIQRLMDRDGLSREQAEARIHSQATNAQKKRHADYIIESTRPRAEIDSQVSQIYRDLKDLA